MLTKLSELLMFWSWRQVSIFGLLTSRCKPAFAVKAKDISVGKAISELEKKVKALNEEHAKETKKVEAERIKAQQEEAKRQKANTHSVLR